MTIKEQVNSEYTKAAKAQDKAKLSTIRLIKTAIHNREIDEKRELEEKEILQVLSSMVKQRKDSIDQFTKGGRTDLVDKETEELKTIQNFMPQQLSDKEIGNMVDKVIAEVGATTVRDMGKVMKALMPLVTGKADGKTVGECVKTKLSS